MENEIHDGWTPLLDTEKQGELKLLREKQLKAFERVLDVMDDLREKCPWDRKQTFHSLRPQTIEEVYELCDAVSALDDFVPQYLQKENVQETVKEVNQTGKEPETLNAQKNREKLYSEICKELGDVLLHIVFYSKLGSEQGAFDFSDVCNKMVEKLVYRHPHVYATTHVNNSEDVVRNWEQLKTKEKDGNKTVLSGVPQSLPSLIKAYRVQDKARAVGFDWEERSDVWDKVAEEQGEFRAALEKFAAMSESSNPLGDSNSNRTTNDKPGNLPLDLTSSERMAQAKLEAEGELGDFIFSVVNASRLYHLNPDTALEMTNRKFIRRFTYLENKIKSLGKNFKEMTLAQMDEIWNEAKALERNGLL